MTDEWRKTIESILRKIQEIYPHIEDEFIFWPLFNELNPNFSLETIREIRPEEYNEGSYGKYIIFLARNSKEIRDVSKIPPGYSYMNQVLCDPKFQINDEFDISKAVLSAELFYQDATNNALLLNVVSITQETFFNDLLNAINNIKDIKSKIPPKIKHIYYDTFIYFYSGIRKNALGKDNKCIERIQFFYNEINGITESTHLADSNLFRAPVPFSLQELIDVKKYIEGVLNAKKIKLLLIDNRSDNKFIDKENEKGFKPQSLCNILEVFGLTEMFEVHMLRKVVYKNSRFFETDYKDRKEKELKRFDYFERNFEEFNFKWFKYEKNFYNKDEDKEIKKQSIDEEYYELPVSQNDFLEVYREKGCAINTYADLVYHKIKSSHFILLDFFLNEENTYLAFDFIKDISKMKKQEGDYSTTWYFITSAVYDSVVKYSQSGLLAEYYESAVVNAGDDPTNEKRQIIFVYKLLTFIQSRLRSFNSYKTAIYTHMLSDADEQGEGVCCVAYSNKNIKTAGCLENCKEDKCLEKMQTHIKHYLTEYDNIWSLFYVEKHERDYKDIAELLDDTIKKFLWLPEADWQMVQHQIDYINAKLKTLGENRKFSCKYINDEIKRRSEIY